ncbi:MAG: hypothetical protein J7M25_12285 [Deltaproteobacteria bacterium]|nr:hypothetical protein [Deltaproteobacteria bacterium]
MNCPECGAQVFDELPPGGTERTCPDCGSLLRVHVYSGKVDLFVVDPPHTPLKGSARIVRATEILARETNLSLQHHIRLMSATLTAPWTKVTVVPLTLATLVLFGALYVAHGIDPMVGIIVAAGGAAIGAWLVTLTATVTAQTTYRLATNEARAVPFGRMFRMLLEHGTKTAIWRWLIAGLVMVALLITAVTFCSLSGLAGTPGRMLLGLVLGLEVLLIGALLPVAFIIATGLFVQPLAACRHKRVGFRLLSAWKDIGANQTHLLVSAAVTGAMALTGAVIWLFGIDLSLEVDQAISQQALATVLSTSALGPVIGLSPAIDPTIGQQVAGILATVSLAAALGVLLSPSVLYWGSASAALAMRPEMDNLLSKTAATANATETSTSTDTTKPIGHARPAQSPQDHPPAPPAKNDAHAATPRNSGPTEPST